MKIIDDKYYCVEMDKLADDLDRLTRSISIELRGENMPEMFHQMCKKLKMMATFCEGVVQLKVEEMEEDNSEQVQREFVTALLARASIAAYEEGIAHQLAHAMFEASDDNREDAIIAFCMYRIDMARKTERTIARICEKTIKEFGTIGFTAKVLEYAKNGRLNSDYRGFSGPSDEIDEVLTAFKQALTERSKRERETSTEH